MPPSLSIVTPVYNGAKYIVATIESILEQSFSDFEYILIDDGSTDESPQILAEYAARDKRIRIVTQNNSGIANSRNRGVAEAKADIMAFLDHDDLALPDRMAKQWEFLKQNPELSGTGCYMEHMTEDGAPLSTVVHPHEKGSLRAYALGGNCPIPTTALMMRRALAQNCGSFNPAYEPADDYEFLLRALQGGHEFALVPEVLQRYRFMQANTSHRKACAMLRCTMTALYYARSGSLKPPASGSVEVPGSAANLESMQGAAQVLESAFWTDFFLNITTYRTLSTSDKDSETMLALEYLQKYGCTAKRKCASRIWRHLRHLSAWDRAKIIAKIVLQ